MPTITKRPRLLPSAIEDDPSSYLGQLSRSKSKMNNQADETVGAEKQHPKHQRKRSLAPSPLATELVRRNAPGLDEGYAQRYQARMAEFWAAKAQTLKEPFCGDGGGSEMHVDSDTETETENEPVVSGSLGHEGGVKSSDLPLRAACDGSIKKQQAHSQPQRQKETKAVPKYDNFADYPPLTNDAIADLLRQCKPESLKAQAWIHAHEASKAAAQMEKVRLEDNARPKRHVLPLRVKTKDVVQETAEKKEGEEGHEVSSETLPKKEDVRMPENRRATAFAVLDEEDKQMVRVFNASARLQMVMCNDEDPVGQTQRIRQSFRKWYKGSG
ncbi:hypothetical protein BJX70DRAFT_398267 [Aspergillus crustosus]